MTELSKFVESARETHKFIQSVVQQYFNNGPPAGVVGSRCMIMSKKLKQLKTSNDDPSAERLLQQIETMRKEYEYTLGNSEVAKKYNRPTTTLLSTVAGTVVSHPHIGAAAAMVRQGVSKVCRSRLTKGEEERHESALKAQVAHYSVEGDMINTIKELGNIKFLIDKVVNEIDSLLRSVEGAISIGEVDFAMKTIKNKMETFSKKIDELNTEAEAVDLQN